MKKLLVLLLIILGIAFLGLAVLYFKTPAGSLPHYIPGYEAGVSATHIKHGLAALILAIGCGLIAWFMTGQSEEPTSSENTPKE